ncbi:hypothetical protein D3C75_1101130 [compost metagenome]
MNDIAYLSEDVQEAINKKFKAEQDQAANAVVNKTNLDRSTNEVAVATKESEAAAKRQATMETQLELKRLENEAAWIEALASGKVTLPSTLVQGQGATMLNIPAVGKPTDEK